VEIALALAQDRPLPTIAEIGTGSGAIAISLALNPRKVKIYATDISATALEVALINCQKHGVTERVHLLQGNMLDPVPEPVDLIITNLPYVKKSELAGMRFEPALALDGGRDGMGKIRQLCQQAGGKLRPGGFLLLEIGQEQASAVTSFLNALFPSGEIKVTPDLGGIDRVVSLSLTNQPA
jgi:release factor glutamine methyltransferase